MCTLITKVCTQEKARWTTRNKNARGHGAPKKNTNAIKHGLFSKYLPQETLQIVYEMDGISPIDILWMNVELQFAQIVRAQQIMHVNSKDDLTKELKRTKHTDSGWEEEYELQFAWDKQASIPSSNNLGLWLSPHKTV
ncbi:hypothetical protein KHA80_03045 [Anaerobacillus sp. HL2]|nr:hypothetical protein KHA80_03045 [Anaerobacillus sp. HL2]